MVWKQEGRPMCEANLEQREKKRAYEKNTKTKNWIHLERRHSRLRCNLVCLCFLIDIIWTLLLPHSQASSLNLQWHCRKMRKWRGLAGLSAWSYIILRWSSGVHMESPLPPDRIDGVWLWPRKSVESLHWHMYVVLSREHTLSVSSSFFSPLLNRSLWCFCPTVQVVLTRTDRRSLWHHVGLNCVSDRMCYPSHPSGCCFCEFTTRYELLLTSHCLARQEQQVTGWKLLLPDGRTSSLYFFNSFPSQMNNYR